MKNRPEAHDDSVSLDSTRNVKILLPISREPVIDDLFGTRWRESRKKENSQNMIKQSVTPIFTDNTVKALFDSLHQYSHAQSGITRTNSYNSLAQVLLEEKNHGKYSILKIHYTTKNNSFPKWVNEDLKPVLNAMIQQPQFRIAMIWVSTSDNVNSIVTLNFDSWEVSIYSLNCCDYGDMVHGKRIAIVFHEDTYQTPELHRTGVPSERNHVKHH